MKIYQLIIAALLTVTFLKSMQSNFTGSKEREPDGFRGAVVDFVVYPLIVFVYWKAGALSALVGQ
jgi:hypothetical protein